MMRFMKEFPETSSLKTTAVVALSAALEDIKPDISRCHILFIETVLLFAISAINTTSTDPKTRGRNVKLLDTQMVVVRSNSNGMSESMVQPLLWARADELVKEENRGKK